MIQNQGRKLKSLPKLIYQHTLTCLNKVLPYSCFCGPLCDLNKQLDQICVLNHSGKPSNLQGRTDNSHRNLDKSRLVQHLVVPDGFSIPSGQLGSGKLVSGCLYECSSNCIAQMGASNMAESLSNGCTVPAQLVIDQLQNQSVNKLVVQIK